MNIFDQIRDDILKAADDTINTVCEDLCDNIKDQLLAGNHYRTGNLYNSIVHYANADGSHDVLAADYLKYIEGGQLLDDCVDDAIREADGLMFEQFYAKEVADNDNNTR